MIVKDLLTRIDKLDIEEARMQEGIVFSNEEQFAFE